ncbi:armadillo-type protein [Sporodiniella umbellata]|nr:armadillo-type protein [Sporodiniella umbellata]
MQVYDDNLTFLLPRPTWINDVDVTSCYSCHNTFGPLRRRHHCRNCGNIFCQDCSSRNVPLPQLGYGTRPVRVCNDCFEVAYLVTYTIDQDHGVSTQIHGVRGLLELAEKDDEKHFHNMVIHGSIDALIWVCRTSKDVTLHHLTTTILAILVQKESIRPAIITKWALPAILSLIRKYTNINPEKESIDSKDSFGSQKTLDSILSLDILINCTSVLYELSKARILIKKEIVEEGVIEILLSLAAVDALNESDRVSLIQSLAAKSLSAISSHTPLQSSVIGFIQTSDKLAHLLRSPNGEVRKYTAKTIAYLSLRNDKYKPILLNGEGSRSLLSILASLPIKACSEDQLPKELSSWLTSETAEPLPANDVAIVSHTCCALANFATNDESQLDLILQPYILFYLCNVYRVYPDHTEVHKHVARCLANFAHYEKNRALMQNVEPTDHKYNVLPTLLDMGQSPHVNPDVIRHVVRAMDNLSNSK